MTYATFNGMNEIATWPVCTHSLDIGPWAAKGMLNSVYIFTPETQLGGQSVCFLKPEDPTDNFQVSFEVSASALPQSINLIIIFFGLNDFTYIKKDEPDPPSLCLLPSCLHGS